MTNDLKNNTYDVAIVGASVAGSVAANLLARKGLHVAIIDNRQFPRRKCCGEGLSDLGLLYLKKLGLWSDKLEQIAMPFTGYEIITKDQNSIYLANAENTEGVSVERYMLDRELFNKAMAFNNVSLYTKKVVNIDKCSSIWKLMLESHEHLSARNIIIAAGNAKLCNAQVNYSAASQRFGLALWAKGRWKTPTKQLVSIKHEQEGEYITTTLNDNDVNMSILLSKDIVVNLSLNKSSILNKARTILEEAGFLIDEILESKGAAAIHSERINTNDTAMFLVGDALERLDPISGMGMTHAICSATLAAKAIVDSAAFSKNDTTQAYYKERERMVKILRLITALSYTLNVKRNRCATFLTKTFPSLPLYMLHMLKKTFPKPPVLFTLEEKKLRSPNHEPHINFTTKIKETI